MRTLLRLGAMLFVQLVKIMDRHTLILPAYSQEESIRSFVPKWKQSNVTQRHQALTQATECLCTASWWKHDPTVRDTHTSDLRLVISLPDTLATGVIWPFGLAARHAATQQRGFQSLFTAAEHPSENNTNPGEHIHSVV